MRTRRLFSFVMALVLMLSMSMVAMAAKKVTLPRVVDLYEETEMRATENAATLYAGQHIKVGKLFIEHGNGDEYLVTYKLTEEGYYFREIHFEAINAGDDAFIYSGGGIIPGKLTVNECFDAPTINEFSGVITGTDEYSFIYTSGAEVDSFAAHSVVCKVTVASEDRDEITGSKTEEGYFASGAVPEQNIVEVREPFGYGDPSVDQPSVWDTAFAASPVWNSKLIASGARFVWNYELSSGLSGMPVPTSNDLTTRGDVCSIDFDVEVPSDATGIDATLYIVADNGYIAKIGDTLINSAGINPFAYADLTDDELDNAFTDPDLLLLYIFDDLTSYDSKPLFVESVVPSSAWKSMIAVGSDVPLEPGDNTVEIKAVNEQMDGGNDYNNPAGVIFFIEYSWTVPTYTTVTHYSLIPAGCETAWGFGEDADGNNWSQIIENDFDDVVIPV